MALAIGPCMFLAPVVFLLALLLIPLWPVAIAVVGALWLVVWPVDRLLVAAGVRGAGRAAAMVTRWLRTVAMPWRLFELPAKRAPQSSPSESPEERP